VGVEIYRLEEWKAPALAGLALRLKDQVGEPAAGRRFGLQALDEERREAERPEELAKTPFVVELADTWIKSRDTVRKRTPPGPQCPRCQGL
jgi:hypothetical protein